MSCPALRIERVGAETTDRAVRARESRAMRPGDEAGRRARDQSGQKYGINSNATIAQRMSSGRPTRMKSVKR